MNEWKKVKLGDCISTKKGFAFKSALYTNCGVPVVRVSDFTLDSVADNDLVYYPHAEKDRYDEYVLNEGDVLIQTVGSWQYNPNSVVGKVVRVPYYHKGSLLNQNIVKIIPNNGYNNAFIFYRLKCRDFAGHVLGEARGAANQASITLDTIKRFSFDCPLLSTQQRIATILSRYDSLIENYRKQIKLLEEAAQRLYKEWFIDLRFPGHENTMIVDGVPEGWEKKPVKTIIELQSGYAFKSSAFMDDGIYKIVTIKNVKDGAFDGENVSKIASIPEKMPKHCILENGDILLSLTGNVGRVCIVNGKNYLLNQRVAKLKSAYKAYTYCLFRSRDMFIEVNNLANGAAQQNVSPIRIGEMKILIPEKKWLDDFERTVSNYILGIITLQSQIRFLTEVRDRLLPKLMSGEIAV